MVVAEEPAETPHLFRLAREIDTRMRQRSRTRRRNYALDAFDLWECKRLGLHRMLDRHHLVAWSAGAMVLSDLIVLFHDRAPQGRRDPEVLAPGCGVLPGYLFLPDATRRLRLNDRVRVDLFSRRFAPGVCVTLDSGSVLQFSDNRLDDATQARRLQNGGHLAAVRVA